MVAAKSFCRGSGFVIPLLFVKVTPIQFNYCWFRFSVFECLPFQKNVVTLRFGIDYEKRSL